MNEKILNAVLFSIMGIATISQANEIFQLIQIIVTTIAALVVLTLNIIAWYKRAKKDGKIDAEELEELSDIIQKPMESLPEKDKEESEKQSEGDKKC